MPTLAMCSIAAASLAGCVGGDIQEAPANLRPEDATFSYQVRNRSMTQLSIWLAPPATNICDLGNVDPGVEFVAVEISVPAGQDIVDGSYSIESGAARVVLRETMSESGATIGSGTSHGIVTLTAVDDMRVIGSFEGTGPAIQLSGTFDARPCSDTLECE